MTLEEAAQLIGHGVVYDPGHSPAVDGIITSANGSYVFVRYRGDTASKATRAEDLELLSLRPPRASETEGEG